MHALLLDGDLRLIEDYPTPEQSPDEALIRVRLAGICNTDLELAKGYMQFRGIPGHEFVGVVERAPGAKEWEGCRVVGEINAACTTCPTCRAGRPTHCPHRTTLGIAGRDGAFAEYLTLPVHNLHPVPDAVPDEVAVFAEPLAAACEILQQVHVHPTDRVVVLGDGKLGLLCAQVLALTGCDLTAVGHHCEKLDILAQRGIPTALEDDSIKAAADLVIEATGWEQITISALSDVILIVGAPDTGKSTLARYLYRRLHEHHERVAFIDGDMGQAALGPPTTMTLALGQWALGEPSNDAFPPAGPRYRAFVGDITPRHHMLPTLVGAYRLVQKARTEGATAIVFDTTGLVDPTQGGGELKRAKVELLRPTAVVGIQRGNELEHLLVPLRRSRRTRVIDLPAPPAAHRREVPERQEYRATRFRHYFAGAHTLEVVWQHLAVFPAPTFIPHRLAALEDSEGFTLALGIVIASDPARNAISLYTPLSSPTDADAIRLGDLALDPHTFRESRLW